MLLLYGFKGLLSLKGKLMNFALLFSLPGVACLIELFGLLTLSRERSDGLLTMI